MGLLTNAVRAVEHAEECADNWEVLRKSVRDDGVNTDFKDVFPEVAQVRTC